MNTIQKITKNIGVMLISQILNFSFGFFTIMYTARYLGADGFGIISLALSITAILGILIDMGLNTLTIREIARNNSLSNKYISNIILMKIILALLIFGILTITLKIIGYSEIITSVIYVITLSVIISSFSGLFNAIFQAHEKIEYLSISSILSSALMLLFTILGVYYNLEIVYFAAIYVITNSILLIFILIMFVSQFSLPKLEIDLNFWKSKLKEAWPFGLISLSGMLYTYIDSIILSIIDGNVVVGWYNAAYRLMFIILFIPTSVNTAIFPVMSRFFKKSSKESLNLLYERYFKYMIIIGIPLGFGTTILAENIILLIFGTGYTQSIIALRILVWAIVFTFAGAPYIQLLQSINKQLIITKISTICLMINIILNFILIPYWSYVGASLATLITEMLIVTSIILVAQKLNYGLSNNMFVIGFKVIMASIIMSIFIFHFKNLNIIILLIFSVTIYFVTIYFLNVIDEVDKELINQIIKYKCGKK